MLVIVTDPDLFLHKPDLSSGVVLSQGLIRGTAVRAGPRGPDPRGYYNRGWSKGLQWGLIQGA